jgi:hypothetical protein
LFDSLLPQIGRAVVEEVILATFVGTIEADDAVFLGEVPTALGPFEWLFALLGADAAAVRFLSAD